MYIKIVMYDYSFKGWVSEKKLLMLMRDMEDTPERLTMSLFFLLVFVFVFLLKKFLLILHANQWSFSSLFPPFQPLPPILPPILSYK